MQGTSRSSRRGDSTIPKELLYTEDDWRRFTDVATDPDDERWASEIDRSRIVHSLAFRRLLGKTQVFGIGQDSFFRTRLTHSLEVAQIAKGLALRLGANVELCEAAGLAHDIGHPPFGHKGELVLASLMKDCGGFEANAQNLRVLALLEVKYDDPSYRGLNLTRATLDTVLKYRTPYPGERGKFYYTDNEEVKEVVEWAMDGRREKPLECELVDWADDIAYSVHDLEDGIHAGMISARKILAHAERILTESQKRLPECSLADVTWASRLVAWCEEADTERSQMAKRKEVTSALIGRFVRVNRAPRPGAQAKEGRYGFGLQVRETLRRRCEVLKALSYQLTIDDSRVASLEARAERILTDLFTFFREPSSRSSYPEIYRQAFSAADDDAKRARVACDFISGMTDEQAERVYSRMFTPVRSALADY